MELQERVAGIVAALKDAYPDPVCALQYKKDYELMIAVRFGAVYRRARQQNHASTFCTLPNP